MSHKKFDWSQLGETRDYEEKPSSAKPFDWSSLGETRDYEDPESSEMGFFNKLPRNIATGIANLGRGLANTPHNIANLAGLGEYVAPLADEHFDYGEFFGLPKEQNLSDRLIQGLTQYAPAFVLPGANIGRAGEVLSSIPKAGGFLAEAASQAIPQALFGATQEANPVHGVAYGGLGSVAGSAVGKGLASGIQALRPSVRLRGQLSPEELARNMEITRGTQTGLGSVIESPFLKRLQENVLPHVLGSGVENAMQRNARGIQAKGQEILADAMGAAPAENYGTQIQEALKMAAKEARNAKNQSYESLNRLADSHGLKIGRENFREKALDVLSDIEKSPELKHEFGKSLYKDLVRYARNDTGNNLKLTNIFRGKLGDKANELYQSGKVHEYGIVNDMKDALSKDIQHSFEQSGNPELEKAYEKSQRLYREEFAPFEDPDIVKYTRRGGDPDLILNHFLKTGGNDRATLLSKLDRALKQNQKSEATQNPIMSAYLSKAMDEEGKLNPVKFRTLYNKLGHNQRKILFGENGLNKKLKDYSDLVGKNTESFNLMFNPKTGVRMLPLAQLITAPANMPTIASAAGLARGATHLLTSPKFREKLVKAMTENKRVSIPKTRKGIQKGFAVTTESNKENNPPLELELTHGKTY